MDFHEPVILGRSGMKAGRLGVACSYGAPTEAFELAFDQGVNYFYWGSRRTEAMARAIRNLIGQGQRDNLIILLQSYSRSAALMELFFQKGLKRLGLDTADVLLLGWHNKPPSRKILDRAARMREKGLFRHLALSGHQRPLFPQLAESDRFDLFHIRYNAAHRGAETEVFPHWPSESRPGVVTYTATRWGHLLNPKKMPPGQKTPRAADCYRFVLSNPAVDVCMTGPKTMDHMKEALKALDMGPLDPEEMDRMRQIGDHIHSSHKSMFM